MAASRYSTLIWAIPLGLIVLIALLVIAGKLGNVQIAGCDPSEIFSCLDKFMEGIKGAAGKCENGKTERGNNDGCCFYTDNLLDSDYCNRGCDGLGSGKCFRSCAGLIYFDFGLAACWAEKYFAWVKKWLNNSQLPLAK